MKKINAITRRNLESDTISDFIKKKTAFWAVLIIELVFYCLISLLFKIPAAVSTFTM